ncbi:MAG: Lrp/AsnC ligand binding domain-containing protein [Candidatus Methanomethylicia archaeon]|jgi:DNA-binding Lrp family transcriptional regulator|nr:Lrp/AsnC ligand binding domain-containing protein [Candidatus Methanomethylicia archaeon]
MPLAYVLINTARGSEDKVLNELKKIEGIIEVHTLYGMYDIIAKVEIKETEKKFKENITWKIRRINEVESTITLIVADPY